MKKELKQKWLYNFNKFGADGIDFISSIPINYEDISGNQVDASFTKDEFLELDDYDYPRLPYVFWKIIFGEKCYLTNTL